MDFASCFWPLDSIELEGWQADFVHPRQSETSSINRQLTISTSLHLKRLTEGENVTWLVLLVGVVTRV